MRAAFVLIVVLVVLAEASIDPSACPRACSCHHLTVDCSARGLTAVPRDLPRNAVDVLLQRNNITQLTMRAFVSMTRLARLNLEHNQISLIHYRSFESLAQLVQLNLNHNSISCIQDRTFRNQRKLQMLDLSNNNLTTLAIQAFKARMPQLRRLRLHSNRLACDCHLVWLKTWLSRPQNRGLATVATCHEPAPVRGRFLSQVPRSQFTCDDHLRSKRAACHVYKCPERCDCSEIGYVDCRDRHLNALPQTLPQDTHQLRFSYNQIELVPSYALADFTGLKLVNLNYNGIRQIDPDAFNGMEQLRALHLQHNHIVSIDERTFRSLRNLEVLFLQNNEIECLKADTFHGLRALTTLSLYGNKLQSLPDGLFDPLRTLFNLYLADNPLQCDCRLRWLTKYLRRNEAVEKSGVRCLGPPSVAGRELSRVKRRQFRSCSASLEREDVCLVHTQCPDNCRCEGDNRVTCSRLTVVPNDLPVTVSHLNLRLNNIETVANSGIFSKYGSLKTIDLSNNQIVDISDAAFEGAVSTTELNLNENKLTDVRASMFEGLANLQTLYLRKNRISCVGNHTFNGLTNLQAIDLYGNEITTIDRGSFLTLTNLNTLNILSNKLNCDCRLGWIVPWFDANAISSGKPRCHLPVIQRNFPISDINPSDFRCLTVAAALDTCTHKRKCPEMCTCEGTVVRCSRAGLDAIPVDDIPDDVTDLFLDRNEIKIIPPQINRFVHLQQLDLSSNQIARLNSRIMANLTELTRLILAYNRIQCVELQTFRNMHNLETLSLQANQLSSIPEGSFDDLTSLRRLDLGENPWHCDCNLNWMLDWMEENSVDPGIARCSGPTPMKDRLVNSNSETEFTCSGPLDMAVATKCNPCLSSPCKYGATCRTDDVMIYQCVCPPGFKGRNCETPIDPCILEPCRNGARCHARNEHHFECDCEPGFEGEVCERNIDDCDDGDASCPGDHVVCVDGVNNFTCQCAPGWSGSDCLTEVVDVCAALRPCRNGAACTNARNPLDGRPSYECDCAEGYGGRNCSERYDSCHQHKCEHGATCMPDPAQTIGYRCQCTSDYTGQYCSFFHDTRINILQDDPCSNNDCANNSTCQADNLSSTYRCLCAPGYTGTHCDSLFGLTFRQNGSYVSLPSLDVSTNDDDDDDNDKEVTFSFNISTLQENGILFYWGQDPVVTTQRLVAVEFFSGHVKVKSGMIVRPDLWATSWSPNPINDGQMHAVTIFVSRTRIAVKVDGGAPVPVRFRSPLPLPPADAALQVGGAGDAVLQGSDRYFFSNKTSFSGCLAALNVSSRPHDFRSLALLSGARTQSIAAGGCLRDDDGGEEATGDEVMTSRSTSCRTTCRHGTCLGGRCRCKRGYKGKFCRVPVSHRSPMRPTAATSTASLVRRTGPAAASTCPRPGSCIHGRCMRRPSPLMMRTRGAQQQSQAEGSWMCKCETGYTGARCDRSNVCTDLDCGASGRCMVDRRGLHRCVCPRTFTGNRCQTRVRRCKGRKSRRQQVIKRTIESESGEASREICRSLRPIVSLECTGTCGSSGPGGQSCCQPLRRISKRARFRCEESGDVVTDRVYRVKRCACKC